MNLKHIIIVLTLLCLAPLDALASHEHYTNRSRRCYKEVYDETYVPGDIYNPGYIRRSRRTVEVPCRGHQHHTHHHPRPSNDSCIEGAIVGGILGGVIGSLGDNDRVGIPVGAVTGGLVGCAIDQNN